VWNATEQVSAKNTGGYGTAAKNAAEQPGEDAIVLEKSPVAEQTLPKQWTNMNQT
jgi:hypothetical protein